MYLTKLLLTLAMICFLTGATEIYSQDNSNSAVSFNKPKSFERETPSEKIFTDPEILQLEQRHKEALENGNLNEANKISSQLNDLTPKESKLVQIPENPEALKILENLNETGTDWMNSNSMIIPSQSKSLPGLYKQVDVKQGENGILYAVLNTDHSVGLIHAAFYVYKSTNSGLNWTSVLSIGSGYYVGNIAMTVEARDNVNPDSTRIIIFYTASFLEDYDNASVEYISVKSNSYYMTSGTVAVPSAGKTFTNISAVSDGAFWTTATYFGAVFSEADNITGDIYRTRFVRTVNWGETWTGIALNTGYNDLYPSADYKEGPGSGDSVYIAVERKFSATSSEIRILATPWSPTNAYSVNYLTNNIYKYEKPCITIKQNSPADSILITATKSGKPVYHFTSNAGASWEIDFNLSSPNNAAYTYCSSTSNGSSPFSACWVSNDGDSINVRRGFLGNLGATVYKVNSQNSLMSVTPVCATISNPGSVTTEIIYASASSGFYSTQEGLKSLNLKIIPQGFYNSSLNRLNMKDTLRLYLRNFTAPFSIIDSSVATIDSLSYAAAYQFTDLSDGQYYFSVKHRNHIETWSLPVSLVITDNNDYNFTNAAANAFGDNQVQVDNSPVRFAIYGGDVDNSGNVNLTDIFNVYNSSALYETGHVVEDITGDKVVNLTDFVLTYNNAALFVKVVRP